MEGEPTENTHFRAASITKTFTAAGILLLQQKGLLNIEDTVVSNIPGRTEPYLPNTPEYAIPHKDVITIRQLLGMQAPFAYSPGKHRPGKPFGNMDRVGSMVTSVTSVIRLRPREC